MAAATRTRQKKIEFENRTQGFLGVVKLNRKNEPEGVPVEPGAHVYLTAEEVELTEQSHSRPEDSPFNLREIVLYDEATGDETDRFTAAPLSKVEK